MVMPVCRVKSEVTMQERRSEVASKAEIARRNDRLRAMIPLIPKPDVLVMTRGIAAVPADDITEIMQQVKAFDSFNEDNDPWREHDFGSFDHAGKEVFWKIDDYGGHDGIGLLLTVILASEY